MKKWHVGCLVAVGVTLIILAVLSCVGQSLLVAAHSRWRIDGSAMSPSLNDGDYILAQKPARKVLSLKRGDVVVFRRDKQRVFIKRVVGLPGETVAIRQGQVFIDEQAIREPYIKEISTYTMELRQIGSNEYFVLGDNRNNSSDSHNWGNVPLTDIIGAVWFIYWPPSRMGTIPSPQY